MDKIRIEIDGIDRALEYSAMNGGWICRVDNLVWWYSPQHTWTEILSEHIGNVEVGGRTSFLQRIEAEG